MYSNLTAKQRYIPVDRRMYVTYHDMMVLMMTKYMAKMTKCISYQHITHNIRFVFIPNGPCTTVYFIKLHRRTIQELNDALSSEASSLCPTFPPCFR